MVCRSDGCIIPDVPLEEEGDIKPQLSRYGINLIRLVSLTSPEHRLEKITERAEGFLYAVAINGVTGLLERCDGVIVGSRIIEYFLNGQEKQIMELIDASQHQSIK
ncbi:MAG: tryptophan synthase subunit alpha [Bacillus sp. (in: firmicutes)]